MLMLKKKIQNIKNTIVKMNLLFLNFLSFFKKNLPKELSTNLEGSLNPERMTPSAIRYKKMRLRTKVKLSPSN